MVEKYKFKEDLEVVNYGFLKETLYTLIGSFPTILVSFLCLYVLFIEHAKNNYSFLNKNLHLSNVDLTTYDTNITCINNDFLNDRIEFDRCAPKYCFRHFNDFIVTMNDADTLLKVAKRVFAYSDPSSSATFLNLETASMTKGLEIVDFEKILHEKNEKLYSKNEMDLYNDIKQRILNMIRSKFNIDEIYFAKPRFFSMYSNKHAKFDNEKYWQSHVDKYQYDSVHYSAILFLNDFMVEFNGGLFTFKNIADNTVTTIQPKKGRVLIYSPGSENENYIQKLLYGNSYALELKFTCDKNFQ